MYGEDDALNGICIHHQMAGYDMSHKRGSGNFNVATLVDDDDGKISSRCLFTPNTSPSTSSIATRNELSSSLELSHLRNVSPLLALFPLQLDHVLDVVLPESSGTIVNMRAALSKLGRVLYTSVNVLAS